MLSALLVSLVAARLSVEATVHHLDGDGVREEHHVADRAAMHSVQPRVLLHFKDGPKEVGVGDVVYRHGKPTTILKIDHSTSPPGVIVSSPHSPDGALTEAAFLGIHPPDVAAVSASLESASLEEDLQLHCGPVAVELLAVEHEARTYQGPNAGMIAEMRVLAREMLRDACGFSDEGAVFAYAGQDDGVPWSDLVEVAVDGWQRVGFGHDGSENALPKPVREAWEDAYAELEHLNKRFTILGGKLWASRTRMPQHALLTEDPTTRSLLYRLAATRKLADYEHSIRVPRFESRLDSAES